MMRNPKISVIIPIKDEQRTIKQILSSLRWTVRYTHEIIIVFDDPRDQTLPTLRPMIRTRKELRLYQNAFGKGVLNAIKTGFSHARASTVVVMAADGTDDPQTINTMYKQILAGYDVVCPTRYSDGGKVIGKVTVKSLLSRLAGTLTPFLLGIPTTDLTYSFKMFKKKILHAIQIESKAGFEFAEELVIKSCHQGYKVAQVPTVWKDRELGSSKFQLVRWLPSYIHWFIWGIYMRCFCGQNSPSVSK